MNSINVDPNYQPISVWSICVTSDDQFLFVGQSNGQLRAFELNTTSNNFYNYQNDKFANINNSSNMNNAGLTHIIQIQKNNNHYQSKFSSQKSLLLKSIPSSNNFMTPQIASTTTPTSSINNNNHSFRSDTEYLILITRLNGYFELIRFTFTKIEKLIEMTNNYTSNIIKTIIDPTFYYLHDLKINDSPITNLYYPKMGDYLLSTSQDCQLKVIKINVSIINNEIIYQQYPKMQKNSSSNMLSTQPVYINTNKNFNDEYDKNGIKEEISLLFSLNQNNSSLITAMCIDSDNILNAATGSQNGVICLWNLFTGECKQKMCNKKFNNEEGSNSILQLELVDNLLISLSAEPEMCFWNTLNGAMIKEFKFFAPTLSSSKFGYADQNSISIISYIGSKLFKFIQSSYHSNTSLSNNTQRTTFFNNLSPIPSMCLYSNKILITGGCSCLFIWNIIKAELIKKINIIIKKKPVEISTTRNKNHISTYKYSQLNHIKEIRIIQQKNNEYSSLIKLSAKTPQQINNSKRLNKLVLLTDYSDSIYILKIPSNIIQNNKDIDYLN
jgi:hypothetical protein